MEQIITAILVAIIGGIFQIIVKWMGSVPHPTKPEKFTKRIKTSLLRLKKLTFSRRTMYWILALGLVTYVAITIYNQILIKTFTNTYKDPCPNQQPIPTNKEIEVTVKDGYIAYFAGWEFDRKEGGFFIKFDGPYRSIHTFGNGKYCPAIPANSELSQKTMEMLTRECNSSEGGCSQQKTCSQNTLEYYFGGGKCHEK